MSSDMGHLSMMVDSSTILQISLYISGKFLQQEDGRTISGADSNSHDVGRCDSPMQTDSIMMDESDVLGHQNKVRKKKELNKSFNLEESEFGGVKSINTNLANYFARQMNVREVFST